MEKQQREKNRAEEIFEIIILKNFPKLMTDTKPGKKKNDSKKKKTPQQFKTEKKKKRQTKFLKEVRENHTLLQNTQPVLLKIVKVIKNKGSLGNTAKRSLRSHGN